MGRPRREPDADAEVPAGGKKGGTQPVVNRIELQDEGVRVLVEIEGLTAVRAGAIMQYVIDKALGPYEVQRPTGGVVEGIRREAGEVRPSE